MKRRNTATQEAVLSVLTSKRRAMSQDAIVKQMEVNADRATIYRILNRFCEDEIVHKIVADDDSNFCLFLNEFIKYESINILQDLMIRMKISNDDKKKSRNNDNSDTKMNNNSDNGNSDQHEEKLIHLFLQGLHCFQSKQN